MWRPISEAKKDGTEYLMRDAAGARVVGRWSKNNHIPFYGWVYQQEMYGEEVDGFTPTHFMEIPEFKEKN